MIPIRIFDFPKQKSKTKLNETLFQNAYKYRFGKKPPMITQKQDTFVKKILQHKYPMASLYDVVKNKNLIFHSIINDYPTEQTFVTTGKVLPDVEKLKDEIMPMLKKRAEQNQNTTSRSKLNQKKPEELQNILSSLKSGEPVANRLFDDYPGKPQPIVKLEGTIVGEEESKTQEFVTPQLKKRSKRNKKI